MCSCSSGPGQGSHLPSRSPALSPSLPGRPGPGPSSFSPCCQGFCHRIPSQSFRTRGTVALESQGTTALCTQLSSRQDPGLLKLVSLRLVFRVRRSPRNTSPCWASVPGFLLVPLAGRARLPLPSSVLGSSSKKPSQTLTPHPHDPPSSSGLSLFRISMKASAHPSLY